MVLTPLDIHNKEFPVKMRGYDQDEVNDYLDQIIKDYEAILKDKKELEKNLKFAEEKVAYYNNLQESLNKSIIVAQEAADRLKENSDKEAAIIIQEAENNADRLLNDSVEKARRITAETEELKKQSRVFKQRLQLMIESQLEMVKNNEWDELLKSDVEEVIEIPTVKEFLKKTETNEKRLPVDVEKAIITDDDSERTESIEVHSETVSEKTSSETDEADYEEGNMPAVEMPL
ncbi:MAG: DivIVA domain-containing protein [Desemzia incerta]|uniref:Cell division initiation protein n=1 Tax=Desemzia incerta TaxID=82801 RepID=A0A1I5VVF9_9LACT|nr:DivIVA domain-containing protein [Desemzia incerta]SFQ11277.1 cell division initiation protein [Desemzia incerta]